VTLKKRTMIKNTSFGKIPNYNTIPSKQVLEGINLGKQGRTV
jgi:hypothetical protein